MLTKYRKLGIAGVSFLFASGDYGVAGHGGYCLSATGGETTKKTGMFNPGFPGP